MSTLKWKKRDEGYIKKTPAGSSIIKPASQMTSQQRSELSKIPGKILNCNSRIERKHQPILTIYEEDTNSNS
jgi:hypothetical protein